MINSAIIKLSKLTSATKLYRGVSGALLPRPFWTPNQYNVRGGVEVAFMSCTEDKEVALKYAASKKKAAIVFEVKQGMVDRGADISWLSQYPHEKECAAALALSSQALHTHTRLHPPTSAAPALFRGRILFGPLTGIEVLSTRIDGSVVVIECDFSINLTALTLEQVKKAFMLKLGDSCTTELENDLDTFFYGADENNDGTLDKAEIRKFILQSL